MLNIYLQDYDSPTRGLEWALFSIDVSLTRPTPVAEFLSLGLSVLTVLGDLAAC